MCPRRHAVLVLGVVFLAACEGEPVTRPGGDPAAAAIVDGGHSRGNPHFFFLAPIAKEVQFSGVFDATLNPVIDVCAVASTVCASQHWTFARGGKGPSAIRIEGEQYIANWKTPDAPGNYRITVALNGIAIGSADLTLTRGGGDLDGMNAGRMLPIKFRLEEGVQTAKLVGGAGGSLTAKDGLVSLDIPPGAVEGDVLITMTPFTDVGSDPGVVPGSAVSFGPDGTHFDEGVTIRLKYDPARLPPHVAESRLRLHKLIGEVWQEVPGSAVDLVSHEVNGVINSFSDYTIAASPMVFAGTEHSCAIGIDAQARCWGDNTFGQLGITPAAELSTLPLPVNAAPGMFATMATGTNHTCALTSDGTPYCWGDGQIGQLGTGSSGAGYRATSPVAVATAERFMSIAAGGSHTCAVTFDGRVFCWGRNATGQAGVGNTTFEFDTPVATVAPPGVTFKSVTTGLNHTCALSVDAVVYCWGSNGGGQAGIGATTPPAVTTPTPVAGNLRFLSVEGGRANTTCAVSIDNDAYCWGINNLGNVGDGTFVLRASPTRVSTTLKFTQVDAGMNTTCGVASTGQAYCWGDSWYGGLGNGTWTSSPTPVAVSGGLLFKSIRAGNRHTCALALDGNGWCWGHDGNGVLGNGTISNRSLPVQVAGGLTWSSITAGQQHTCGLSGTTAYCWGRNLFGSAGWASSVITNTTPLAINGSVQFTQLSTNHAFHSCGLTIAGAMYCWGSGIFGQLGNGSTADQSTPVPVQGGFVFSQVAVGGNQNSSLNGTAGWFAFSCGLTTAGQAVCWGRSDEGELATGTPAVNGVFTPFQTLAPTVIPGHTFTQIAAGRAHACGIEGTQAWCWGAGDAGQLGNNAFGDRNTPQLVVGGHAFKFISAGEANTCAIDVNDDAWCWGQGAVGRVGNGVLSGNSTPFTSPQAVSGGLKFSSLDVGTGHSCGITTAGDAYCWGENDVGQLGNGTHAPGGIPVAVAAGGLKFVKIDASFVSSCGITTTGALWCWGHKGFGRLGNGEIAYHNLPVAVQADPYASSVHARR